MVAVESVCGLSNCVFFSQCGEKKFVTEHKLPNDVKFEGKKTREIVLRYEESTCTIEEWIWPFSISPVLLFFRDSPRGSTTRHTRFISMCGEAARTLASKPTFNATYLPKIPTSPRPTDSSSRRIPLADDKFIVYIDADNRAKLSCVVSANLLDYSLTFHFIPFAPSRP